jgi:antitoxin CptB
MELDSTRLRRLQWRCRRGLLENDLILARFLEARGRRLEEAEEAQLSRLLDLTDGELWDLLAGRTEPADPTLRPLVSALRAA